MSPFKFRVTLLNVLNVITHETSYSADYNTFNLINLQSLLINQASWVFISEVLTWAHTRRRSPATTGQSGPRCRPPPHRAGRPARVWSEADTAWRPAAETLLSQQTHTVNIPTSRFLFFFYNVRTLQKVPASPRAASRRRRRRLMLCPFSERMGSFTSAVFISTDLYC